MLERKIQILRDWFSQFNGTITAFSAGVDSSLVLYMSKQFLPKSTIACISDSESLKRSDFELAKNFCRKYNIPLEVIETKEILDDRYNSNPSNRCFICKSHLYSALHKTRDKYPGYSVLNGTNKDDFSDYRPGLEAAYAFKIRSPLAESGLGKSDIRDLAQYYGLPNWNKPSSPCLSSRIPYGQLINTEKLKQIESAEALLNSYGFEEVRVRHYNREARIEVPPYMVDELRNKFRLVEKSIMDLGFEYCTIDNEGFVSGKLNRSLNLEENGRAI